VIVTPGGERSLTSPSSQASTDRRPRTVALIGNPNTGKTSIFNALTGYSRHVANYPGVTVEIASGPIRGSTTPMQLVDLPGAYSLAARSPDEQLVSRFLAGRVNGRGQPDVVLAVVDAANLPRNLYLISQVLEVGLPVVIAVNMVDLAAQRGITVDCSRLSERLGVPVSPTVAIQPATLMPLIVALAQTRRSRAPAPGVDLPGDFAEAVGLVRGAGGALLSDAEAVRLLVDRDTARESDFVAEGGSLDQLKLARSRLNEAMPDAPAAEVRARYAWVQRVLGEVITRPEKPIVTWSDRLDWLLMHKLFGTLVLAAVLFLLFQSVFTWAGPVMDAIGIAFAGLGEAVGAVLPEGVLRSLVVDGLIAGVGGVLVFLPQILILFAFIAVLEDCGYMARAAHMMDRVMRAAGLSGRAFIPLLSSFACAVPAIMGARTIADRRERIVTILIAPFMSCSARLPVYVLLIAAFVPAQTWLGGWIGLQGLVMMAMYLVGVAVAIPLAWLLRRSLLRGPASGFVMELPSYKIPRLRAVWQRMYFAGRSFVVRAGTIILLVNLVVWFLAYFPRESAAAERVTQQAAAESWEPERLEGALAGLQLRDSFLGRAGRAIEPAIAPLGWDWRIGVGVLASFPAREVIVATMGTIFNLGAEEDETSQPLREALQEATWPDGRKLFTLPVALSIMVFFALCAQCTSTLAVIAREANGWGWAALSFFGMTAIAYLAAWGVSAAGTAIGLH
jgi:ferrous iron transport protein B